MNLAFFKLQFSNLKLFLNIIMQPYSMSEKNIQQLQDQLVYFISSLILA